MDLDTIIYIGASIVLVLVVLIGVSNYGILAIPVVIFAIATLLLIILMNFADFLIFPIVTKSLNMEVILSKEHRVPKAQNCIIKYVNGLYYATGYLTANIYKYVFSAESINPEEQAVIPDAPDKWERIIMNTKFPFKFNLIATAEDVQKYREDLEGQRGFLEFQLSREQNATNPNPLTIKEFDRKINIIQARIDRISEGELPTYSIMYIESTSVGVSEKEASDLLTEQLNHLSTVFNSFDLSINRVVGRELHALFGLNYRLLSVDEMSKQFQIQN